LVKGGVVLVPLAHVYGQPPDAVVFSDKRHLGDPKYPTQCREFTFRNGHRLD
jgi:hypothetical protein